MVKEDCCAKCQYRILITETPCGRFKAYVCDLARIEFNEKSSENDFSKHFSSMLTNKDFREPVGCPFSLERQMIDG